MHVNYLNSNAEYSLLTHPFVTVNAQISHFPGNWTFSISSIVEMNKFELNTYFRNGCGVVTCDFIYVHDSKLKVVIAIDSMKRWIRVLSLYCTICQMFAQCTWLPLQEMRIQKFRKRKLFCIFCGRIIFSSCIECTYAVIRVDQTPRSYKIHTYTILYTIIVVPFAN